MTSENFCYWLQGKLEIDGETRSLTKDQVEMIKEHLQLVFIKKTNSKLNSLARLSLNEDTSYC